MRLLIAPDSFKGSLSASDAADAIRRGAARVSSDVIIDVRPLSDGGEGLVSVLAAGAGRTHRARVTGPMGEALEACWLMLPDGRTAVLESATAIGLTRIPEGQRAALETTSYGVGELIREAMRAGAHRILVGLGGTATTDGGAGMAQALGVAFDGVGAPLRGGELGKLRGVDPAGREPGLVDVELVGLTDVDNPLTGANGAARTYGPQKGATELEASRLDAALSRLASLAGDGGTEPGDGAAGGLGYGLRVFAGARLRSGIDYVLDAVGFDGALDGCDLVLTGEGRLDAQSSRGKVVAGVSRRCRARGIPVVALVGSVGPGGAALLQDGLTAAFSICDGPIRESDARERAASLLETSTYNAVRLVLASRATLRATD